MSAMEVVHGAFGVGDRNEEVHAAVTRVRKAQVSMCDVVIVAVPLGQGDKAGQRIQEAADVAGTSA